MTRPLEDMLVKDFDKAEIVAALEKNPELFSRLIDISVSGKQSLAWRAPWVISGLMQDNDLRIKPRLKALIDAIDGKKDGYQRELLKIIYKMDIPEELEGALFDKCSNIWEVTKKSSSVRIMAFRIMIGIAKKYPELKNDLLFFTQQHYTETLSPGIKKSLLKMTGTLQY